MAKIGPAVRAGVVSISGGLCDAWMRPISIENDLISFSELIVPGKEFSPSFCIFVAATPLQILKECYGTSTEMDLRG